MNYNNYLKKIKREHKETKLNQHSLVIWMTGLSGSGKTSIATYLEQILFDKGYFTQIIDGDDIRDGINKDLGFSLEERWENIRRAAEISKILLNCGVITICCFISPTNEIRNLAKKIVGKENIIEVFVNASIATCEKRDTKGLYSKARAKRVLDFTGISSVYEIPLTPQLTVDTENLSIEESALKIMSYIEPLIRTKTK